MDKLIVYMSSIDIYDLTEQEVQDTVDQLIKNVSITKLKRAINSTCKTLAGVSEPCFGADLNFIWRDNQDRLNLIWKLMDYSESFENYYKNIKANKRGVAEDYDYIFGFLLNTCDIMKTIKEVYDFKLKENLDNQKQLEDYKTNLLEKGGE